MYVRSTPYCTYSEFGKKERKGRKERKEVGVERGEIKVVGMHACMHICMYVCVYVFTLSCIYFVSLAEEVGGWLDIMRVFGYVWLGKRGLNLLL